MHLVLCTEGTILASQSRVWAQTYGWVYSVLRLTLRDVAESVKMEMYQE